MPNIFLTSANNGKRIVLWTLAIFIVSQLVFSIYLNKQRVATRDPLYGWRLTNLRARMAESPNAPLLLLLGSSRVKYSVLPGKMAIHASKGEPQPIVYNFGINGLGTIRELLYLRRLLADGIRPQMLLLEIWPPLWAQSGFCQESRLILGEDDLSWRDLPLVCRYFLKERAVLSFALKKSFLPISCFRSRLLKATVRSMLPRDQAADMDRQLSDHLPADHNGWFPLPWEAATPEAQARAIAQGAEDIKPLLNPLRIDSRSDSALREVLDICRQRGIRVSLIMMPEHSQTRAWYSPQARTLVRAYLNRLQKEEQVAIIDTRDWVADNDFADSCHMGGSGVPAYSERLGREVLQPMIDNRPFAPAILYSECDPQNPL